MEAGAVEKREDMVSKKQGEFLLDEVGEGEEEIIELLDVVEEPEPKMSIENFIASGKERSFEEIASLDSWDKLEFEEKPVERDFVLRLRLKLESGIFHLKKRCLRKKSPLKRSFLRK